MSPEHRRIFTHWVWTGELPGTGTDGGGDGTVAAPGTATTMSATMAAELAQVQQIVPDTPTG